MLTGFNQAVAAEIRTNPGDLDHFGRVGSSIGFIRKSPPGIFNWDLGPGIAFGGTGRTA